MNPTIGNILLFVGLFISLFFEIFVLINYFEKKHIIKKDGKQIPNVFPSTTIIVPCFNEEKTVGKTIESLLKLDYPKDKLKILVIDDGSKDKTLEVAKRYETNNSMVSVYSKENGGKYTALNHGLLHTQSELVGCLDADSFVDNQALKKIVAYFNRDKEVMAVTPAVVIHNPQNVIELIQKVEYAWGALLRKILSFLGAIYVTPGPFSIFRKEVFENLGNYKLAHHTEDFEMAMRMQSNHYKIENAHDAFVYTTAPKDLRALIKQRTRWSYGFLNNMLDYKHMVFNPKFGNISIYILPMAVLSIFSSLFFFFSFLFSIGQDISRTIEHAMIVGLSLPASISISWLALQTNARTFLIIVTLALSFVLIVLSKKLTEGRFKFGMDIVYFLSLYGFIVPFWLMRALYSTVLGKSISWR